MAQYGQPKYWEERYTKDPEPFDWYQRYSENPNLKGTLNKHISRDSTILVPGCGSSRLSEEMFADGYQGGIVNIDISRTVIDLMSARAKGREGLQCAWVCQPVLLTRTPLARTNTRYWIYFTPACCQPDEGHCSSIVSPPWASLISPSPSPSPHSLTPTPTFQKTT